LIGGHGVRRCRKAVGRGPDARAVGAADRPRVAHIGGAQDDIAVYTKGAEVVAAAGLVPFNDADYRPGRRLCIFDRDGSGFEVVSNG
jgi:hypothetical protein